MGTKYSIEKFGMHSGIAVDCCDSYEHWRVVHDHSQFIAMIAEIDHTL